MIDVPNNAHGFSLRPYSLDDCAELAHIANDRRISQWMSARFPYPYALADAETFIRHTMNDEPRNHFLIEVDGAVAGGLGVTPHAGEILGVAEFGYWLAPPYWGRGIMTQAARAFARLALRERGLRRLEAHVFSINVASMRVLEKCGFTKEALLKERYIDRDGIIFDAILYAKLASEVDSI